MSTSSASKTKPRDNKKTPNKVSGTSNIIVTGAYNPLLGTFQTVETGPSTLNHNNGRFRHIDESDSTGADCDDSVSNNGSWSGDSEDHKEKVAPTSSNNNTNTATKQEVNIIPGADNDKREKMRLKNERKHQRQKEKRAHELHERCCQYLMSRKLEVLAQQIVQMGFAHERATYALMLNEGKIEESVNWLFDDGGANVTDKQLDPNSGNLKLDISQELSNILELETKYKCTKQDVERAVVQAEGDIDKAEESLRSQKEDQSSTTTPLRKPEEVSDNTSVQTSQNTVVQLQQQPNTGGEEVERRNVTYPRGESLNQTVHSIEKVHMKLQALKIQKQNGVLEEKKRMMAYQQQTTTMPQSTEETHYVDQFKRQELREPVMLMQQQRSQSANTNVLPVSTMNSSFTAAAGGGNGWYPTSRAEAVQSNGYLPTRSLTPTDLNAYQQLQYQQYQEGNNSHRIASVSVAPAASLGLFSGNRSVSSSGSTSGLDWNMDGSIGHLDYNNIDWSLDRGLACPRPSQPQQQYVSAASPYESLHMNGRSSTRVTTANGNGMGMAMGLQEAALVGKGRDWTSPFEGKDLFSLSRQYVPPSL